MYCSGDVWLGNVTRSYADSSGQPVVQSGYYNALVTLDWLIAQQSSGKVAEVISSLGAYVSHKHSQRS